MTEYIDKSAVVAEIERRKYQFVSQAESFRKIGMEDKESYFAALDSNMNSLSCFLDTLEVKEVKEEPESIWHDANKQPTMYRKYLVRYSDGRVSGSWERHDDGFIPWKDVVKEHGFTHWCYVEDLIKL